MVPEELAKIRSLLGPVYEQGRYEEASRLVADLVESDTFVEFLTLPAYEAVE